MPKSRGRPASRGAKRRRPQHRRTGPREPDLLETARVALSSGLAWPLLDYASHLLDLVDERNVPPDLPPDTDLPTLDGLIDTFVAVPLYESSALLAALGGLAGNELLRLRVRGEIADRGHELPEWLAGLDRAVAVDRAVQVTELLEDGYQVLVGATLPGGQHLTAVVFIDNNQNSALASAFVVPRPLADIDAEMRSVAEDPDLVFAELSPADARVHITEAIEEAELTSPPTRSDDWPATRPLVEWMASLLPSGGSGRSVPEWSDEQLDELADRFFASPLGMAWRDRDVRPLVDDLLSLASVLGAGDPRRISPTGAEILLIESARLVAFGHADVDEAPRLLRDVVRFGHAESGLRADITDDVLRVVDEFDAEYRDRVEEWRRLADDGSAPAPG